MKLWMIQVKFNSIDYLRGVVSAETSDDAIGIMKFRCPSAETVELYFAAPVNPSILS